MGEIEIKVNKGIIIKTKMEDFRRAESLPFLLTESLLKISVTIQKVVSREAFWHVFCQNPETYKAKCHHRR